MKEFSKNPRKITPDELEHLKDSYKRFGELGVITHDLDTDEIISGNQRAKVIDINNREITILAEFKKPKPDGTLKIGTIEWEGNVYFYRGVKFKTQKDREQANIQANKLGGEWVFEDMMKNFDYNDLLTYGFHEWELAPYSFKIEDDLPNVDLLGKIDNRAQYIIIQFDTEDEIKAFREKFGMKPKELKLPWKNLEGRICAE
jgi:hypothetical protein